MRLRSLVMLGWVFALLFAGTGTSQANVAGRSVHRTLARERVLFSFLGFNGAFPEADVAVDSAGNVYGTTFRGPGTGSSYGLVYQLSPTPRGPYKEHILHKFGAKNDGIFPTSQPMTDAKGNVYGTVSNGGLYNAGIVFELKPNSQGKFTYQIAHAFDTTDGNYPASSLFMDASGNIYGTTVGGGPGGSSDSFEGAGVIYELSPSADGTWKDKTLHIFNVNSSLHPNSPYGGVLLGSDGTIYGTTSSGGVECSLGGSEGCGTAFALTLNPKSMRILYRFGRSTQDAAFPHTSLVADAAGNLFGASGSNNHTDGGVIFELMRLSSGKWKEIILRRFSVQGPDGYGPSGLVFDAAGNLYGTQGSGGKYFGGTAFVMSPTSSGQWSYTVIYNFGKNQDAAGPNTGNLVFDAAGNLYGSTFHGGLDNFGTVYELTP